MEDFLGFLFLAVVAALMVLTLSVIFAPAYVIGKYQFAAYQSITSKPTKYAVMECYIQDGGKWYSEDEYKNRLVTKGEMK